MQRTHASTQGACTAAEHLRVTHWLRTGSALTKCCAAADVRPCRLWSRAGQVTPWLAAPIPPWWWAVPALLTTRPWRAPWATACSLQGRPQPRGGRGCTDVAAGRRRGRQQVGNGAEMLYVLCCSTKGCCPSCCGRQVPCHHAWGLCHRHARGCQCHGGAGSRTGRGGEGPAALASVCEKLKHAGHFRGLVVRDYHQHSRYWVSAAAMTRQRCCGCVFGGAILCRLGQRCSRPSQRQTRKRLPRGRCCWRSHKPWTRWVGCLGVLQCYQHRPCTCAGKEASD